MRFFVPAGVALAAILFAPTHANAEDGKVKEIVDTVKGAIIKPGIANPMDKVADWRPPPIPPRDPLFSRTSGGDMTGVWQLHVGFTEQEAYSRSKEPALLYLKFVATGVNQFAGRYFHPSIAGRSWPACDYSADFAAETYAVPGDPVYQYPVISMVQSSGPECVRKDAPTSFQTWNGLIIEAGTGGYTSRTIKGTVYNNNGNWLHILLVRDEALSAM